MRVPGNTPKKSPSLKAAQYVADENNVPLNLNLNTDHPIPNNLRIYKYLNLYTRKQEILSKSQLLVLCSQWLRELIKTDKPQLRTFWREKGILMTNVTHWAESDQDISDMYLFASQIITEKRENRLLDDPTWLRNTQAMWDTDVNAFEEKRINMRSKLDTMEYQLDEVKAYIDVLATKVEETEELKVLREKHARMLIDRANQSECRDENPTE